jgi:hypothetical protein
MCELAAVAGCDPEPRTLRELAWMAEAADKARWNRTSALIAQIYNANRPANAKPISPMDFYPWHTERVIEITPAIDRALREVFPGKGRS